MTSYTEFFLNSKSSVVHLETLEISHSAFSRTFYIVRNAVQGVTVTLEDGNEQFFEYYPLRISPPGNKTDLDQSISIELGDLGELIPTELDRVKAAGKFDEKPVVKYRAYRSDDLELPLIGPWVLEIANIAFNETGCVFEAKAPSLNVNRTGELYKTARFPMLRGFV